MDDLNLLRIYQQEIDEEYEIILEKYLDMLKVLKRNRRSPNFNYILNFIYWETEVSVSDMTEATKLSPKDITKIVCDRLIETQCPSCFKKIGTRVKTRSERNQLITRNYNFSKNCEVCKKKLIKSSNELLR